MKVGFIGLGLMGSRMAANLQKHGHALVVFNRTPHAPGASALVSQGALWAETPAAAAGQVEVLFTMLAHPPAVLETALGEGGFLDHLRPGALWVDCSTVNPSFTRQMAEAARQRAIRFLDAPVAGSKRQAEQAELVFLVGGPEADVQACRPLFDVMGNKVVRVGEHGQGTALKMVLNLLLATSMAAFSEGLILGQALGLSQEKLFEVLIGGPVVAPFLALKRKKIEQADYEADFPLRWMHKDLQLAAATAYEAGVALPVGSAAKETYRLAIQHGLGQKDFSAIYAFLADGVGGD